MKNEKGIQTNDTDNASGLKADELSFYKTALDRGANIVITDVRGKILHVNDVFCETTKYSREELLGQNPRVLNSGYHPKQFWDEMYATVSAGKIWRAEVKNRAKDGSFHWLDTTIVPFMNEQGKPFQYLAMRYNITQRKELEAHLVELNTDLENRVAERTKESENRKKYFKALVEYSQDAILLLDKDGFVIYQNPAVQEIGGYAPSESYGKNAEEFFHPEHLGDFSKLMYDLIHNSAEPIMKQYRVKHKNGNYVWVEGTISSRLGDNAINALVINYRDITKRKEAEDKLKQSEELYRSLFNNMLNGFAYCQMIYDENDKPCDFTYLSVNHKFVELTGLKNVEGKRITEIVPGILQTDAELIERYGRVASTGIPEYFETYVASLGDWSSISVYSPQREYFVAVFDVITKRKLAEKALETLNAELEERVRIRTQELNEANKALDAFSYTASHDLRAPVRAAVSFTKIIQSKYGHNMDPGLKELFEHVVTACARMNAIIEDLLGLAKYGKETLKFVEVDMGKLTEGVWQNIKISTANNCTMQLQQLPVVWADHSTMEQVLVNLISNAVKYSSKKEKPQLEIWCEQTPEQTTFFFKDNGAGFDMKNYDRLFSAFQRLHSLYEFEGTGIGLSLVKKIIEKHGGTVGAEGKVGEGATFYFTLPAQKLFAAP